MDLRAHLGRHGPHLLPGPGWARASFLLLLLLAAVLRGIGLGGMPYLHDELSAIIRLYPTLGETIRTGVVALDTHPPGVQVFEWLWSRLFGTGEGALRLPFVVMSLLALVLLYRVACRWANVTVALVIATLLGTLQFGVLYGTLARPYAVGLFTTALAADQLTCWVATGRSRHALGFALGALLSAYTHHFALMLAGLMGLTGLGLTGRTGRRTYLLACAGAVLLYLPNVPLFLKQLGIGGLQEWLRAPDRHWLPDHVAWLTHYNSLLLALLTLLVLTSLSLGARRGTWREARTGVLLCWGLTPLAAGLAYSVWRAPVLQHSLLLFSFPYLLMALLLGLPELRRWTAIALVAGLAGAAAWSLTMDRLHYDLLRHGRYEAFVRAATEAETTGDRVLLDAAPEVLAHLETRRVRPMNTSAYLHLRAASPRDLLDSLRRDRPLGVVLGLVPASPPEWPAWIEGLGYRCVRRVDLLEGSLRWYRLDAGTQPGIAEAHVWTALRPGASMPDGWSVDAPAAPEGGWLMEGREYGMLFSAPLEHSWPTTDVVELHCTGTAWDTAATEAAVVIELRAGDTQLFWRSVSWGSLGHTPARPGTAAVALPLGDVEWRGRTCEVKAYVWNPQGGDLRITGMEVAVRSGNPVVYGLTGPITSAWTFRP